MRVEALYTALFGEGGLLGEVGWAGLADIALMTLLCYGALEWLRASRFRRTLRGSLVLAAVYLAARFFELELAATALEALFVVALVAGIVLYGDEIRRLVENIASFANPKVIGPRAKGRAAPAELTELARVVFDLARASTGALVVIEGREPLGAFLQGGVDLDGLPGEAMLKSLFHKTSMAHDGAMVVRGGRVWRFGCHLPLSSNFEALGPRGTRHAAALGLSEKSDALIIAVSEERGTVSVCERGKLETVDEPEDLVARLQRFLAEGQQGKPEKRERRWHPSLLALAILISALSWVALVYGGRPVERSYTVEVETASLPPDLKVLKIYPERVQVTVKGAGRDFYLVREASVRVVVPLAGAEAGQRSATLGAGEVELPRGTTLKSVQPAQISLFLQRR
jgi:diadenylate cyclase